MYAVTVKKANDVGPGASIVLADERGAVAAQVESVAPVNDGSGDLEFRFQAGTFANKTLIVFKDELLLVSGQPIY